MDLLYQIETAGLEKKQQLGEEEIAEEREGLWTLVEKCFKNDAKLQPTRWMDASMYS